MGFRVWGIGLGVKGLGLGFVHFAVDRTESGGYPVPVSRLGVRAWDLWSRVHKSKMAVETANVVPALMIGGRFGILLGKTMRRV